jgi:hypothetical protein
MRRVSWLVLLGVMVAATMRPAHGQVKAYTRPLSRDTVVLHVTINGEVARIGVQNGAMARVSVVNGPMLGLIPVVRGSAVDLMLVEIRADRATGNEGVRQLAVRRFERGTLQQYSEGGMPLDAELVEVNAPPVGGNYPSGPCTTCCVTCGDKTICSCWVIMDCGRCCCDTACICWESTDPSRGQTAVGGGCDAGVRTARSKGR